MKPSNIPRPKILSKPEYSSAHSQTATPSRLRVARGCPLIAPGKAKIAHTSCVPALPSPAPHVQTYVPGSPARQETSRPSEGDRGGGNRPREGRRPSGPTGLRRLRPARRKAEGVKRLAPAGGSNDCIWVGACRHIC